MQDPAKKRTEVLAVQRGYIAGAVCPADGGGLLRTGQHLHCPPDTPLANLWLTHARSMGQNLKRFADSTDVVKELLT